MSGKPKRNFARAPWALAVLLGLALLAGYGGKLWWALDLASHFRVQYAYAAAALIGWMLMVKAWRGAVFCGAILAISLVSVFGLASPNDVPPGAAKRPTLKLFFANVRTSNQRHDRLLQVVAAEKPDVVLLQELDERWLAGIAALANTHPHRHVVPRPDNFGIGVYSKLPLVEPKTQYWGSRVPSISMKIEHGGRELTILLTHPVPPRSASMSAMRDQQLSVVARMARESGANTIVIGDLNITPFSAHWGDFLDESGLLDSARGYVPQPTWPTRFPSFCRIPIDHCLHSADLEITDRRLGPKMGSDHLPLIVTLR